MSVWDAERADGLLYTIAFRLLTNQLLNCAIFQQQETFLYGIDNSVGDRVERLREKKLYGAEVLAVHTTGIVDEVYDERRPFLVSSTARIEKSGDERGVETKQVKIVLSGCVLDLSARQVSLLETQHQTVLG